MSINIIQNDLSSELAHTLREIRKQVNRLGTDDFSTVGSHLKHLVEEKIAQNPYLMVSTALGIGYGLGSIKASQVKTATLEIARLVAIRILTNMQPTETGEHHAVTDAET